MQYRNAEDFKDFIEYNDLGLPIAYAIYAGIVEAKEPAHDFVDETFTLFLTAIDVEDTGFDNLDEILVLGFDGDIK